MTKDDHQLTHARLKTLATKDAVCLLTTIICQLRLQADKNMNTTNIHNKFLEKKHKRPTPFMPSTLQSWSLQLTRSNCL